MAVAEKVPSILKGLSPRQLAAIEWMAKYGTMLDISQKGNTWSYRSAKPFHVKTAYPEGMTQSDISKASDEFRSDVLGKKYWSGGIEYARNQLGTALLNKGLLTEVAEVEPERVIEGRHGGGNYTQPRVARYTLSDKAREAVGGVKVALDEMRAREAAAVAREKAWEEASAPLQKEYRLISQRKSDLVYNLRKHIEQPTPDALVEAHAAYQRIMAEADGLNLRLEQICQRHGKEYKPFTW